MDVRPTLPFPNELCGAILEYLSQPDLKSFSCCSKTCRELAVPFLYRSIRFNAVPASSLAEGGALFSRLRYVRKLRYVLPRADLTPRVFQADGGTGAMRTGAYLMKTFTPFTDFLTASLAFPLTWLQLNFSGEEHLEINLFHTMFSRLSQSRVHTTLRRLTLSYRVDFLLPLCTQYMILGPSENPYETLMTRHPGVLGPPLLPGTLCEAPGGRGGMPVPPPNLTEASLCLRKEPVPQPFYYYFFAACPTLRKFTINAARLYPPNSPAPLYHSSLLSFTTVTHLHVSVQPYPPADELTWVSQHFPCVEDLTVELHKFEYCAQGSNASHLQAAHKDIRRMRALRKATIPWPRLRKPMYGNVPRYSRLYVRKDPGEDARHLSCAELECWVTCWRDGGAQLLRTVVFDGYDPCARRDVDKTLLATCEVGSGEAGYAFSWTGDDAKESTTAAN
ncbi:hypothetical protein Dda_4155 [Drechslerella dactyloides]|uniref:F-box domain-containing protein n=1 Tax=Drechslerella dactyloides TaxID=74499 RepID=A0AAD6IZA4_DREDA|nr:hypothetical protein Dda_4155 [Drechslerella dactyloides]